MQVVKIVYWEEDGAWIGYLQDYPDYWTQGESLEDLREHPTASLATWNDKFPAEESCAHAGIGPSPEKKGSIGSPGRDGERPT